MVYLPASRLRRERRELLRERERRLRDLGGLMLEMFRRDRFRRDLLLERCAELVALEERVAELDAPPATRCACGAAVFSGSRFCGQCGRPVST